MAALPAPSRPTHRDGRNTSAVPDHCDWVFITVKPNIAEAVLAERVLPQIDHAERVLVDFAKGRRGALRVGVECHPCQQ